MDTGTLLILAGIGGLLASSAFFSSSETALMSASRARLHQLEEDGEEKAALVRTFLDNPERLLSTILLGNNLVNIAASSLMTGLCIKLFGEVGVLWATIIMTVLVLIFAEVLPKTIASHIPEKLALLVSKPMKFLIWSLHPITWLIRQFNKVVLRFFRFETDQNAFTTGDVRGAIGLGLKSGVLEDEEHRMLDGVLDLDEITVGDVMTHRRNIESIPHDMPLQDIAAFIKQNPHSRIPVWKENPDNIIGTFHIRDFFLAFSTLEAKEATLIDIIQEAYFVPETVRINQQLSAFRQERRHLALVVDEYGDLMGLVTLEDILEEIVGEIEDEHDLKSVDFIEEAADQTLVSGHYAVRDANRELGWNLPEEEAVTIAGLMVETLGHIPTVGEKLTIGAFTLTVVTKKRHAIVKIRVTQQLNS